MKKVISAGIIALLLIGSIAGGFYYLENYDKMYYTKIDNSQMEILPESDEMRYEYNLKSIDDKGKSRKLKFRASKELKEGAYLQLEVRAAGVYQWKEVQLNEMPEKVQEKLK